jgi:heme/copper-type cytochrome/quinol oxidase subunit 2
VNWKRFLWASLVIFVVRKGLDYLIDTVILMRDYEKLNGLLRPDVMSTVWLMFVVGLLVAFLFTYIFVKGREGKGIQEGVRFGIIIGLFVTVPAGLGAWMLFPIPMGLIVKWILNGLLLNLISGILAAAIYKPAGPAKP